LPFITHYITKPLVSLKVSCVASALQMVPKGIEKLMTVSKQFALRFLESKPML